MNVAMNAPRRTQQSSGVGWYVLALVASLGVHGAFWMWSTRVRVQGLQESRGPNLVPPRFVVKQVTVDPRSLQEATEAPKVEADKAPNLDALIFTDSKPQAVDVKLDVKSADLAKSLVQESRAPAAVPAAPQKISTAQTAALDAELSSLSSSFLQAPPVSTSQPVLAATAKRSAVADGVDLPIPGRISIEQALARIGQVDFNETPVAIPGRALFAHNSVELGPDSIPMLEKIAQLRGARPDYVMQIVGHTDATGTLEYNQRLSQRRAEAVKEWLVKRYGMDASKIETVGKGSSDLRVPATGSVDEQAPNRRVEVVFKPSPNRPLPKPNPR